MHDTRPCERRPRPRDRWSAGSLGAAVALSGCGIPEPAFLMSGGPEAEARSAGPTPASDSAAAGIARRMTPQIGVTGPGGSILRSATAYRYDLRLRNSLPALDGLNDKEQTAAIRQFTTRLNHEFCGSGGGNDFNLLGGTLDVAAVNDAGQVIAARPLGNCRE